MVAPVQTPTDKNVKIPEAVRRLAEQADAALNAAKGPPPAEVTPEVTPEVIPEVASSPIAPVQDWEHAFKSMKGRHDSAQNNIRAMSDQMTALQAEVAALRAQPAEVPAELRGESFLSDEIVTEYGAEFLDVVGKKALEQLSPEMKAIKKELDALKAARATDTEMQTANARNAMNTALDDNIPSWRGVNVAPEFHSWLALPDPISGAIRMSLLSAAYEQNNTPRVAAIFNGFLAHEAALAPAPAAGEPDLTAHNAGKIPLESFAAPGRAKTSAAAAPVEKLTFTTRQVSQFYADVSSGKYRGRDEERSRIDTQIIEAGRDGRVFG